MSRGDSLERLRHALEEHGCTIRGTNAQCPAHDDRNPSLSVTQGDKGAVVKCHQGCTTDAVLDVLGMRAADLFDEPRDGNGQGFRVVAEYKYTDERGTVLFVKERRSPKDFRCKRPNGRGGWSYTLGDTRRVLYNLPAVLDAIAAGRPVYVVEGEKDADAIGQAGDVATCNFDGAAKDGQRPKWRPEYGDYLKGAVVVVIADKDPAGYAHAAAVKADLDGKASFVIVAQSAEGNDVSDHLAAGHTLGQLVPVPAGTTESAEQAESVVLAAAPRYPRESLVGPLRAFVDWATLDGLHPETAAAAGLAALVSLTGPARLKLTSMKEIRAILWIALIGIPSSGKSPAFEHAFARIRSVYAAQNETYAQQLQAWETHKNTDGETAGPRPVRPQPMELDDATPEAVARWLLARKDRDQDPSGAVIDDELAATLEGMNQYKGGIGSDRSKWLKLWTGADLSIMRVGKGGAQNEVHIYVPGPVVSLAGPLTDSHAHLMGKQGSGFRPRFLPHIAPAEPPAWNSASPPHPAAWTDCVDALLADRKPRTWLLGGVALAEWNAARARWRRQQDEAEPDDVIEALRKADAQCYRIALVIAESLAPAAGGDIPVSAVRCAVAIVDYVIGCWRALPGADTMASSRAEEVMDAMSARFLAWLNSRPKGTEGLAEGSKPRPRATRRQVQQWSHLKPSKVDALIAEHGSRYPGSVVSAGAREGDGKGAAGGKPTRYVYAPERAVFGVAATPNNPVNPASGDDETAGQDQPDSVLRPATPNERNTESATPNDGPAEQQTPPPCPRCGDPHHRYGPGGRPCRTTPPSGQAAGSSGPACGHCDGSGHCSLPSCRRCGHTAAGGGDCTGCGGTGSRPTTPFDAAPEAQQ